MHLLVTGGCGFIGANFVRFVLRERPRWRVTNLDALTYSGNPDNLRDLADDPGAASRYAFVRGDVCDEATVGDLVAAADAIVHMAAESHVDRSIADATPFTRTNVIGTQTLLDVLRRDAHGAGKRFLHVSTDEVFGDLPLDRPEMRFDERSPCAPSSPYAASKAASDLLVLAYRETFGLDVVVTNCSNNHGRYQFPEKVIPLFVTRLMRGESVPLYGDGQNVRDWIEVEDHCEAVLAVLERGRAGERYCIGGNNERSNLELTHAVLSIMGKDESFIEPVPDRPGHDRRYAVDTGKIERELGWRPTRSVWPEALERTVAWYLANERWCERVRTGAYRRTPP